MANRADKFHHPLSEAEVIDLVNLARESGRTLRVRGAGHSEPGAYEGGIGGIDLLLDRMVSVEFDDANTRVTVQAGCHLGVDPEDPTQKSNWENSLFGQLDRRGWALPDMGGITRQTVAGFLSTGSAGGSVGHSPGDVIVAIRLVDGTGQVHEFTKSEDTDDPFYAAGVSLGLLGVITAVTLQCVSRYAVQGVEKTTNVRGCAIDLFGAGNSARPSLETFFGRAEHSRLLWWPQPHVDKMTVWQAKKVTLPADFEPKPYEQVRKVLGSSWPAYMLIRASFKLLDGLNPPAPRGWIERHGELALAQLYHLIAGSALKPSTQEFHDFWWRSLPMDDGTNFRLLPTSFTELWLPLERTPEAMRRLRDHYERGGFPATGTYACELYASPASSFWMSPAYERPSLRIDPFWFKESVSDPYAYFYPQFWDLFRDMDYRLHWGKALLGDVEYLRQQYPRWDDFMRLRAEMDPEQVFVTPYWRQHLGIAEN